VHSPTTPAATVQVLQPSNQEVQSLTASRHAGARFTAQASFVQPARFLLLAAGIVTVVGRSPRGHVALGASRARNIL